MSKEVPWTDRVLREFIERAMLSEDEIFIMTTRIKGWTVSKQAMELHVSESTIANKIRDMKLKYDRVQAEYPDLFPVRNKKSAKEKYMDEN